MEKKLPEANRVIFSLYVYINLKNSEDKYNKRKECIILPQLTDRQRTLLRLINQMSQNTTTAIGTNSGFAVDFPSVDLNVDLGGISSGRPTPTPMPPTPAPIPPAVPTTMRELLFTLINEQVQVTVPFGTVSGLLLTVRDDYIVVVEAGSQVLIRIEKIEFVSEL